MRREDTVIATTATVAARAKLLKEQMMAKRKHTGIVGIINIRRRIRNGKAPNRKATMMKRRINGADAEPEVRAEARAEKQAGARVRSRAGAKAGDRAGAKARGRAGAKANGRAAAKVIDKIEAKAESRAEAGARGAEAKAKVKAGVAARRAEARAHENAVSAAARKHCSAGSGPQALLLHKRLDDIICGTVAV